MDSPDQITIETPEQTALEFPLAGIGSRFLALAFDTLLQVLASVVLFLAYALIALGTGLSWPAGSQWTIALIIFAVFLINFVYYAFFESIWNGQTPGKRSTRLRVIKDSGRPITPYDAIARNLLRIVDSFPGLYVVAIVAVLVSRQNKRLGDYVAGTVVVHEQEVASIGPLEAPVAKPAARVGARPLSSEELELIETFLQRRSSLDGEVRRRMADQIFQRVVADLGVNAEEWPEPETLLESLAAQRRGTARFG